MSLLQLVEDKVEKAYATLEEFQDLTASFQQASEDFKESLRSI